MSETNLIEVKMHGIEAKGTIEQIVELKKLLDEQNSISIKFIPQTQLYPYRWTVQPYIPTITFPDKSTIVNPNTWKQDFYCGSYTYSSSDNIQTYN